jgi:hypothetical protein
MRTKVFHYVALMSLENEEYDEFYIKQMTHGEQLKIVSQSFSDYDECIKALNCFNKDLLNDLTISTQIKHNMAWESNPLLVKNPKSESPQYIPGKWDQNEIIKVYLFAETEYNKLINNSESSQQEKLYPTVKCSVFFEDTNHLLSNKFLH